MVLPRCSSHQRDLSSPLSAQRNPEPSQPEVLGCVTGSACLQSATAPGKDHVVFLLRGEDGSSLMFKGPNSIAAQRHLRPFSPCWQADASPKKKLSPAGASHRGRIQPPPHPINTWHRGKNPRAAPAHAALPALGGQTHGAGGVSCENEGSSPDCIFYLHPEH